MSAMDIICQPSTIFLIKINEVRRRRNDMLSLLRGGVGKYKVFGFNYMNEVHESLYNIMITRKSMACKSLDKRLVVQEKNTSPLARYLK